MGFFILGRLVKVQSPDGSGLCTFTKNMGGNHSALKFETAILKSSLARAF